jgi:hypothetical protein
MKIVSNFKDYYDSIQAYGADETLVYKRVEKEEKIEFPQDELLEKYLDGLFSKAIELKREACRKALGNAWRHDITARFLFFCGKVYPYVEATLNKFLTDAEYAKVHPLFQKYLDDAFKGTKVPLEFFSKFNSPVLLISRERKENFWGRYVYTVKSNVSLQKIDFQKTLDPFTCYQELSMYISNFLLEKETIPDWVGDDKVIAKQKGFGEESFRTRAPGAKKVSRKLNRERKKNAGS